MTYDNSLMRINNKFKKEIEEIIEGRENRGMTKLSHSKITLLLTKHKGWNKIQNDLINFLGYEDA